MYSQHYARLDTPPPASQFRRPWSPDPMNSQPSRGTPFSGVDDYFGDHARTAVQRREPSDASIEALDLADYSRQLQHQQHPHSPFALQDAYPPYPPSPRPIRPLASTESFIAPSLTSGGDTTSSQSHRTPQGAQTHRPFSLPARSRAHLSFAESYSQHHGSPASVDEIDIGHFPAWSRGWYASPFGSSKSRTSLPARPADAHAAPRSPEYFDPAFSARNLSPYASDPFSPTALAQPYPHPHADLHASSAYGAHMDESQRGILPWGAEPPEYGAPVDEQMKEERMRMLEREFGGKEADRPPDPEEQWRMVGGVDERGKLITEGPKKRAAVRVLEGALALCAAITSIYAAVMIKPAKAPPPQGKPATYILYVFSVVTVLATFYTFLIRPCCFGRRRKPRGPNAQGPGGMMVLPVQQLPGGKAHKKGKKKGKKGGPHGAGQGDVQVNLIVDPGMFGRDESSSSDEDEHSAPGGWDGSQWGGSSATREGKHKRKRAKRARRRSVFAGLAMEEDWRRARTTLRRVLLFDIVMLVAWGAEFVYVLIGDRCPTNQFNGWCDAFNVAAAAACLIAVTFGFSVFFDIKDLHMSRVSPRTRT